MRFASYERMRVLRGSREASASYLRSKCFIKLSLYINKLTTLCFYAILIQRKALDVINERDVDIISACSCTQNIVDALSELL